MVGHLGVEGPAEGGVEGGRAFDVLDRAGDEQAHAIYTCKIQVRCRGSGLALRLRQCRWGAAVAVDRNTDCCAVSGTSSGKKS